MLIICKTLILLILELIIEYCFGTFLTKNILKREVNPITNVLTGFLGYQALFQIASLGFTFTTGVLHHLTIVWCAVLSFTLLLSIALSKEMIKKQILQSFIIIKAHKEIFTVSAAVVILFCYLVSVNGEHNEDAAYYIGLMTTTVDTDTLFKYNVYNGFEVESLYLRRALATFEIHSSVLCQMFQLHPLVIARIFRASQNVILTSGAVLLVSHALFWENDKEAIKKSLVTMVVFWFLQMCFLNTIYTPATFVLYRAYEAKAFTANLIVLVGLYLCISFHKKRERRIWGLIFIYLWGSMALSTSALIVATAECVVVLLPVCILEMSKKRKQEKFHAE